MTDDSTLAIQLYSLRDTGSLEQQLDIAQAAGFPAVETIQSQMEDASATRVAIERRGMKALSGHVSLGALRDRLDWVIDSAKALGLEWIIMPAPPVEMREQDAAGWKALGAELNEIAAKIQAAGLKFGYHNHAWEMKALPDGSIPLDLLFEAAPDLSWQADVAWLIQGGADPVEWLKRYGDRLASIHVKDIAPAGEAEDEDGWADVGHGTVDWKGLWALCGTLGVHLMIAEHDKPSDGQRFAMRSFAAMQLLSTGDQA